MKVEKNENSIIATLTPTDCMVYGISSEDFINHNPELADKIKDVCMDAIKEANVEEEYSNSPISVQAAKKGDNIIVEIEKMPEIMSDMARILSEIFGGRIPEPPMPEPVISTSKRMILFDTLSEAIDVSKILSSIKIEESVLSKYQNKYYMEISFDEDKAKSMDMILCEFVSDIIQSDSKISYISEHSDVIIEKNAIQTLLKI